MRMLGTSSLYASARVALPPVSAVNSDVHETLEGSVRLELDTTKMPRSTSYISSQSHFLDDKLVILCPGDSQSQIWPL